MNYNIALEIMCARRINYERCGDTSCQPKKDLEELIELVGETVSKIKTIQEDGGE